MTDDPVLSLSFFRQFQGHLRKIKKDIHRECMASLRWHLKKVRQHGGVINAFEVFSESIENWFSGKVHVMSIGKLDLRQNYK